MPLHQTLARVSSTNQSSPHQISPYWSSPHQCLDAGNETKVPQSISRFIQAITTDIDTDTAAMASCNFRALRFHGFPNQFLGLSYYVYYYFDDIGDWNANLGTEPDTDNVGQIISTSLDQVTSKIVSSLTKLTLDESDATINGTISNSAKLRPCKMAMLPVTALLLSVIFLVITILVSRRHKHSRCGSRRCFRCSTTVLMRGWLYRMGRIMRSLVGWRRMRSQWRCDWRSRSVEG